MVQLDKANKAPGIENSGTMLSYSPFQVYRCCQHNISHGWPYSPRNSGSPPATPACAPAFIPRAK